MSLLIVSLVLSVQNRLRAVLAQRQRGQATAEYALALLGAAALALTLAAWAAKSGALPRLFDRVVDQLIAKVR